MFGKLMKLQTWFYLSAIYNQMLYLLFCLVLDCQDCYTAWQFYFLGTQRQFECRLLPNLVFSKWWFYPGKYLLKISRKTYLSRIHSSGVYSYPQCTLKCIDRRHKLAPANADVECRRQIKSLKLLSKMLEIQIFIYHIWFQHENCIKMTTNKPSIGSVALEIALVTWENIVKF